jgi:transposase
MQVPEGYILVKQSDYDSLLKRLSALETLLSKDSSNSSKPPSSDGLKKKPKNNREKSSRKQGAQTGHKGNGLKPMAVIDETIACPVLGFCSCGSELISSKVSRIEKRQVIDTPTKLTHVREYHVEVKRCNCGKEHKGHCDYSNRVQYGTGLKSMLVYFNQYQLLPAVRIQELMKDLFGISTSDGLLFSSIEKSFVNLAMTLSDIKGKLKTSTLIHNDETGVRCEGKTKWVHVTSNEQFTYFNIHDKRGREAINDIGILPVYKGISVHDRWSSYDIYSCVHSLCNAHLLRDLKFVHEEMNRSWALEMIQLLKQANKRKKENELTPCWVRKAECRMDAIIANGEKDEPVDLVKKGKRGRCSKNKSLRLIHAFRDKKKEILLFLHNKEVPFDNNLAERDLRMVKLKQKISGCFRSKYGAEMFCGIRSYISTVRKQGFPVLDAIKQTLNGDQNFIYNFTTEQ